MLKEEDVQQLKQKLSVEHFETFEADKQLRLINSIKEAVLLLRAVEEEFPPKHMDELFSFLESKQDEFQVIYNIRTNRKLDEFFK
jgi:hypothetical protein